MIGRDYLWLIAALFAASAMAAGLWGVRVLWSWKLQHGYLIWNLFLAWLPLAFAFLACCWRETKLPLLIFSLLWLLFLPNAPYLVTDLVHLRERPPVPLWFDMVLLQSFIWLGLVLGFLSLFKMQSLVAWRFGGPVSWAFVIAVVALTGFGIYLGRVERWRSWDLLLNPIGLMSNVLEHMFPPRRRVAGLFSALYAAFFFIAYLLLYALTQLKFGFHQTHAGTHDRSRNHPAQAH